MELRDQYATPACNPQGRGSFWPTCHCQRRASAQQPASVEGNVRGLRMFKQTMAGLALVAALGAGVAQAADLPRQMYTKAPPPLAPMFDWTGFYIGGNVGYGSAHNDISIPGATGSEDLNGIIGGGQIGYNWQTGAWVFGLEADFQGSDQHNTTIVAG